MGQNQDRIENILNGTSKATSLWATTDAPEFTPSERQKFDDAKPIKLNPFVDEFIPRSMSQKSTEESPQASLHDNSFPQPGAWNLAAVPRPIARPVLPPLPPPPMIVKPPPPMPLPPPPPRMMMHGPPPPLQAMIHLQQPPPPPRRQKRPNPPQNLEPAISRMVIQLEASDKLQFIPHIRILKQLLMEGKTRRKDIIDQLMTLPEKSEPFKFLQSLLDHGENLILKDSSGLDLTKDTTLAENQPNNKDYFNLLYLFQDSKEFLQRVYIRGPDGRTKKSCRYGFFDVNGKYGVTFTVLWRQENNFGQISRAAVNEVERGNVKKNSITVWNHNFEAQCSSCDIKAFENLQKMKAKLEKFKRITRNAPVIARGLSMSRKMSSRGFGLQY